ncbi:MAG: DUF2817 domain-containing protein [Saprospiraceae bacterium]|nr:DUF2817 domain-containing protein [Saprospiraceae bacterium]
MLFFAQQHGNEQSGKEGVLLLAKTLLKPEYAYLFNKIDLVLIPQVNPDGSELNKRRNANNADLNRNHLIMTEPETKAIHKLFDKYLFEVTVDVHEYSPYGDDWKKYGYRKNTDVTLGSTTNINIPEKIRKYSDSLVLPFVLKRLKEKGFSSFVYCPGGPPDSAYIRHSTFDINDGRQSLGIQNTLSFIQEGMNGIDTYKENIRHRAEGQMNGMLAMLEFIHANKTKIKKLIKNERKSLLSGLKNGKTSVQMIHTGNGKKLTLPLRSYFTGNDTIVLVDDYRPVVKSLTEVINPIGYLIPKSDKNLLGWMKSIDLKYETFKPGKNIKIEEYLVQLVDSTDFEGDTVIDPDLTSRYYDNLSFTDYYYIPVDQFKGKMIIQALEPKSMIGLATYRQFAYLVKEGTAFPVLRIIRTKN